MWPVIEIGIVFNCVHVGVVLHTHLCVYCLMALKLLRLYGICNE